MKKYYLNLSFVAMLFATVFFSGSCGKKSSDPAPAPVVETGGNANTKPNAPKTEKRETTPPEKGTGRPPVTEITVGDVKVLDPVQQRNQITDDSKKTDLDKILGVNAAQLRSEATTENKDFGWFVADVTLDGVPMTDQEIYDNGLQTVIFFNIDSSGYYWQFENKSETWIWGTYGIDAGLTKIAFDFDAKNVPAEVWEIANITADRLVVKGKFNMDDDSALEEVIIGLNGYDLSNDEFSGKTVVTPQENAFLGKWTYIMYDSTLMNYVYTDPYVHFLINSDGTCVIDQKGEEKQYGSWVIETIPGSSNNDLFYLYLTFYDPDQFAGQGGLVTETHAVVILDGFMVTELTNTTSSLQSDIENIGETFMFQRQ